jgi:O-Antigen ligase
MAGEKLIQESPIAPDRAMASEDVGHRDAPSLGDDLSRLERRYELLSRTDRVMGHGNVRNLRPSRNPTQLVAAADVLPPAREWVVAAALYGLMLVVGFREGGFWQTDALVTLLASLICLIIALVANPTDRRSAMVLISILALASWWLVRAATTGSGAEFLPLGSSIVAFAAAFAAVRPLQGRARELAGLGVACLGAAGAVVGFAGLIWRWYPMAMPAQGLWRLSSTLTYSDAAGLALGVCLLLALGSDVYPWLTRIVVCLCAGGLLATQSRGAYVAFICACAIVPWRRYVHFLVPLLAGVVLGVCAIASSPEAGSVAWLGVVLVLMTGLASLPRWNMPRRPIPKPGRLVVGLILFCLASGAAVLVHHELTLRAFAPSDQDRSVEWSAGFHQWMSAPLLGVGPDRLLVFHASDGTFAHFAHNEYLQISADSGVIGLILLAFSIVSVVRIARRSDPLASCAVAALVCWAVAGAFDFDWHLPFIGFLGGWCVGLARQRSVKHEVFPEGDRPGGGVRRGVHADVPPGQSLGDIRLSEHCGRM